MKLSIFAAGVALAMATTPAMAQLAGSGNLVSTAGQQPGWPGVAHQSTTMVNAGGGTGGAVVGANGGDLAPGVNKTQWLIPPSTVSKNTPARSAGGWVEVGPHNGGVGNGAVVRGDVANNLGTVPSNSYRSVDVNLPAGGAAGANPASGLITTATGKLPTK